MEPTPPHTVSSTPEPEPMQVRLADKKRVSIGLWAEPVCIVVSTGTSFPSVWPNPHAWRFWLHGQVHPPGLPRTASAAPGERNTGASGLNHQRETLRVWLGEILCPGGHSPGRLVPSRGDPVSSPRELHG
ncbi:hypothetical protein HF521_002340 [Silurus meridionalis]|uniref:Uncharacterized protein n=1 Tax=Silurus meridionalis TaxID=175797 RepID=A0A8T0B5C0_SILME|nr:hypothetical protein HF521_002340 [Silurus meridionalis]